LDKSVAELTGDSKINALPIDKGGNRPDGKTFGDFNCHGNWAPEYNCAASKNTNCKFGYEWNGERFARVTNKKGTADVSYEVSYGIKQCHQFNATIDRYNEVTCSPRFAETRIISEACDSFNDEDW
jgi:hypothetical protein